MRPSRCRLSLTALLLTAIPAAAQTAPTAAGGAFLLLPVGARATALGQAAAADGGTSEALFWNPAGLAALARSEFAIHHATQFFGATDAVVIAVPSSSFGTFALAAYIVDYGEDQVTLPGGGDPVGTVTSRNLELLASYATDVVGGLAAGIAYKLIQFRVDCSGDCANVPTATGTTHAVDVGLRYVFPAFPLVIGAVVRNVGFKLQVNNQAQADPLPARLQVGVSYGLRRPPAGVEGLDVRVLADLQGAVGQGTLSPVTLVGVEWGVRDVVRIRGGYAFLDSEARGPSIGIGVTFGSVAFDIAKVFFANDDLGEKEPIHLSLRAMF
ncbi:MAG: PorV/PorQ family protein [Gemmatimonadales bacterium]|nr:PorV/PorQ family protein [Gemmatimonadales bacterium]